MRYASILLSLFSIGILLSACGEQSTADEGHLCRSAQASTGSVSSRDLGNTRTLDEHNSILSPKVAWEFEAASLPQTPYSLPIFWHMIGILNDQQGAMTVDFVDGLLGIAIRTDPLPADTRLVEVIDDNMFVVTDSNELIRIDLDTGKIIWELEFVDPIAFRPVIGRNVLFIASGTATREQGYVVAIDLESGEELWSSPIPPLDGKVYPIMSPNLLVTPSAVIVNGFGFLYAFDRVTGELCWDTESAEYGLAMPSNSASLNDDIVLFESDGKLLGLDEHTGDIHWSADGIRQATDVASSGNTAVVVGENNNLTAVDITDGSQLWQQSENDYSWAKFLIAGETVYATTDSGMLIAHDMADGEVIWEMEVGAVSTQMYATEDRLYVLADGVLICITD